VSGLSEHMEEQCNRLESLCRRMLAAGSASAMVLEIYAGLAIVNVVGSPGLFWVCAVFKLVIRFCAWWLLSVYAELEVLINWCGYCLVVAWFY